MDPLNISVVDGEKEINKGRLGVDITAVITYKTHFVVNGQPVIVFLALG